MESIPESQSGTVEMSSLIVKIDERYVLESLSMNFSITVKPSLKFAVNLDEIKGILDAAVHNADHILVDKSRRMMESGIPEELLDQKRTYADLVRFQNR